VGWSLDYTLSRTLNNGGFSTTKSLFKAKNL
jgi:hypothetical protein